MHSKSQISKVFTGPILWLLCPIFIGSAQNFNSEVKATIKTNGQKDKILEVLGIAKNLTKENKSLHYELSTIVSGKDNNSSKTSQRGYFTLAPYEIKKLSHTSVAIAPKGRTILLLLIYDKDNKLLGTARKVFPIPTVEKKKEQASYKKPYEGLRLHGMVTEKTKTKAGKDFYKIFYQKYRLSGVSGHKIIEIDETNGLGRMTKLVVKIDRKIIFQFYVRPKEAYLEQMANILLRRVNRYFGELKKRKQYINQY